MIILSITIAVAITIILFTALIKQTMRAERAEAAIARVDAVVLDKGRSMRCYHARDAVSPIGAEHILTGMRQRAAKLDKDGDQ